MPSLQQWPNALWIVATPIGNLSDFTDRGREALRRVGQIVCEDTRRTGLLLQAAGISTEAKLTRLDAHATARQLAQVIEYLSEGNSVALVTDAGTPAISDPGSVLVDLAHRQGIRVIPVPGASAVPAFLSVSGFTGSSFCFDGFFPRKSGDQARKLESLKPGIHVWFESPKRILETLQALVSTHIPEGSRFCVAKELTKIHERVWTGTSHEVLGEVRAHLEKEGALGEWVLGVQIEEMNFHKNSDESSDWVKALHCLLDARVSASDAAKRVSHYFGVGKNEVYQRALEISGKKSAKKD